MQMHPIVTTALVEARRADAARRSPRHAAPRRRPGLLTRTRETLARRALRRSRRAPLPGGVASRPPTWLSRTAAVVPAPHPPPHR